LPVYIFCLYIFLVGHSKRTKKTGRNRNPVFSKFRLHKVQCFLIPHTGFTQWKAPKY
jgi:hypothetical protein